MSQGEKAGGLQHLKSRRGGKGDWEGDSWSEMQEENPVGRGFREEVLRSSVAARSRPKRDHQIWQQGVIGVFYDDIYRKPGGLESGKEEWGRQGGRRER